MKTILKGMVALSLVSSVAMGAKIYGNDKTGRYIEKDIKIEDDWKLLEFAKDCNLKLEYGKDENNVERIIAVMANGEKAIVEYFAWGNDGDGDYWSAMSDLWVKKDGERGILSGYECPRKVEYKTLEDYKKELKNYIPNFSEDDYLKYIQD